MGLPAYGTFYVYILQCADDSYYVGLTRQDLDARYQEHTSGHYGGYTSTRRPLKLMWSEQFGRLTDAIACERRLKGFRREKKEALIRGELSALPGLARTAKQKPSLSC